MRFEVVVMVVVLVAAREPQRQAHSPWMGRLASPAISLGQTGVFAGVLFQWLLLNELQWIRQNEHYKVAETKKVASLALPGDLLGPSSSNFFLRCLVFSTKYSLI